MADFVSSLNSQQRSAVELPPCNALILAGAGSGKTRVLTTRIAWLISQGMAKPSEILAVTFTNKAAREMRDRLSAMITADSSAMWIGTFHGICHRILRAHAIEAGLPKTFQIIDSTDQASLVKRIAKELNLDAEKFPARSLTGAINRWKEEGVRSMNAKVNPHEKAASSYVDVYKRYEALCQEQGLVDFAELLLRCVDLLSNNEILREHYSRRFSFVLVDEFQDTNVLQYGWLKLIAPADSATNSLFCVGDDDQSIYAFRGARVGNMADFVSQYHVKNIVRLEQNYRSTQHILDAANAVIANNGNRLGKNLWTDAGEGEKVRLYAASDERDEARRVTQEILEECANNGSSWQDFAILYRNNAQSRVLEQYLNANGIPYRIYGGLRFFDREEVKHVTAYLRLLSNPNDDNSFERIVNVPARGIGALTQAKVRETAQARFVSQWRAVEQLRQESGSKGKIYDFLDFMVQLREDCRDLGLSDLVRQVITRTGLDHAYDKRPDADIRRQNMMEVVTAAQGYCEDQVFSQESPAFEPVGESGMSPLDGFLAQAALEADDKNQQSTNCVQLMTVHSSKGLEFPEVFLCGLEDGLFPNWQALQKFEAGQRYALDEERRLMYVAMTRAKRKLWVLWAARRSLYGRPEEHLQSCFIKEIPSQHLEDMGGMGHLDAQTRAIDRRERQEQLASRWGDSSGTHGSRSSYGRDGFRRNTSLNEWKEKGMLRSASSFRSGSGQSASSLRKGKEEQDNRWGLHVGDYVNNPVWGKGQVVALCNMGRAGYEEAQVKFSHGGVKKMMLAFAKLEKLS